MAHKNFDEDVGKSLVRELRGSELLPSYNTKAITELVSQINTEKDSLVSALRYLVLRALL